LRVRTASRLIIPAAAATAKQRKRALNRYSTNRLTILRWHSIFNLMVELYEPGLDDVFHALGDATRRRMLRDLASGERTVSQLAAPFAISLAAASKHIKALENDYCRLDPGPLASANEWLRFYERFWTDRLDMLERLLRDEDARQPKTSKSPEGDEE